MSLGPQMAKIRVDNQMGNFNTGPHGDQSTPNAQDHRAMTPNFPSGPVGATGPNVLWKKNV